MTSTPDDLAAATRDLALAALHEITPASTVGPAAGHAVEESGAVSLRFENRLPGYPGWFWTVTVAAVDEADPTVLEVELLPGDGALLAPDWVPWAERLAEYRAHQAELAEQAAAVASEAVTDDDAEEDVDDEDIDDDDEDEDSDDEDFDGDDEDGVISPRLHAGDLDGVDIDELDDSVEDEEPDESEDSDDESEDEDEESAASVSDEEE